MQRLSNKHTRQQIKNILVGIEDLKPLPGTVVKALQLLDQPDVMVSQIVSVKLHGLHLIEADTQDDMPNLVSQYQEMLARTPVNEKELLKPAYARLGDI